MCLLLAVRRLLMVGGFAAALTGCAVLPANDGRSVSSAVAPDLPGVLNRAIALQRDAHPGLSGIHPLGSPLNAFAARMLMLRAAEHSLDLQYYIWRSDLTGMLLFDALREAADRGVRVRLLLDDQNTSGLDGVLATLNGHANIEVRLFNPYAGRSARALQFLGDFTRLNRRMHNKSLTVDNQVTLIGGRNMGDAYFGAADGVVFTDRDVLAVGPVVGEVSSDFDRYWAALSSCPTERLLPTAAPEALVALAEQAARSIDSPAASDCVTAVSESTFVAQLLAGELPLVWASTRMVSDPPSKVIADKAARQTLASSLADVIGQATRELQIVSPYFTPTRAGVQTLQALRQQGVQVSVLTNSLEATDVAVVHAGYAKHRQALLRAGVRLFELRRASGAPKVQLFTGMAGSSAASLHAKTFAVDGERLFVGSFNFNPRSASLNTELGFVIESPVLGSEVSAAFNHVIPERAYELRLADDGAITWTERANGDTTTHTREPGTGPLQRSVIGILSALPIDWLL
jgi:putative cardiolipin synthase